MRLDFENTPDHELLATQTARFASLHRQHQAVLFSDYGKGGLAHIALMIEQARQAGQPVLIDPKGSDYSRYQGATLITPNRAELEQVIGRWSSEEELTHRAQALRQSLQLQGLLLTRSEEGMTLFDEQGQLHVPAQAREVFDVTGAGDTVIATMATLMAAGASLRQAVPVANRAGGIVVGKFGTACVSYDELFSPAATGTAR
jgi:rfaE bifunctional protein kinase chain/domain